ncbi:MAG: NrtA/SsuA/CpmA family ABC transporter substrate-binding protein [Chloroflexi bacterium]|nr:NrtA/SsuA/CpmA family ABC transporter substrate-binding protein [Chloroflexota bacterium]
MIRGQQLSRSKTIAVLVAAILLLSPGMSSCTGRTDSIVVAWSPFESTALLWIAEDQHLFSRNSLNITLRKYDTGAGALDGMLKGEADIAMGVAEFPVVGRVFRKEKMRIIGNADKAEFIYLIGRKDRGIEAVSDLKGKRVGTTFGTVAHFYLGRFFNLNGMDIQDVTLVDVKTPEEWVNAVAKGDIDAIATAQPYASLAKDRLGANAVVWPAQSGQLLYGLIASSDQWITKHPELASRFLKSVAQAEEYLIRNPAEAKTIVQKRLNLDAAYVEAFWPQNQFSLSLDQALILAMEDEARWMISNNLTTEKRVPDFLDYIYENALKAVKPGAVNIIR